MLDYATACSSATFLSCSSAISSCFHPVHVRNKQRLDLTLCVGLTKPSLTPGGRCDCPSQMRQQMTKEKEEMEAAFALKMQASEEQLVELGNKMREALKQLEDKHSQEKANLRIQAGTPPPLARTRMQHCCSDF